MITEEIKNKNFRLFLSKLNNIGIDSSKVEEVLGESLLNGSFSISNENGCAYDGSLLHVVLRTLTPFAIKLNELLPEEHRVSQQSIVKVCLLSHISKCRMFEKNDNQWEIEKKGMAYKYAKSDVALKMGLRPAGGPGVDAGRIERRGAPSPGGGAPFLWRKEGQRGIIYNWVHLCSQFFKIRIVK